MTITPKPVRLNRRGEPAPVIVQILPELVRGGVERGTVEMTEAIVKHGGRAVVISNGGPMVHQVQRAGGVHHMLDVGCKNPLRWPAIRRRLKDILLAEGASLVHVRSRAPAWIALPVAAQLGLLRVSTVHGRFWTDSALKRIYNRKILEADHVIAISNYVRDLITCQYDGIGPRLTVIQRGVDTGYFDQAAVNQTRIVNFADSVALPEDVPVIMLPARATAWKGQKILLEALAKLPIDNFVCLLVGAASGSDKFISGLTRYGDELGLAGRFRLTPMTDDMPAALMVADVVVMPSTTPEPFGRVALEAQAMGRPVIAFNHGGAAESIRHGETGWLVAPGDVDGLAAAIEAALSMTTRQRQTMAAAARQHIETYFSTETMCRQTLKIYRKLCDAARRNTSL
jgi:glycosyltransferase involved in cell wall biosynthesis